MARENLGLWMRLGDAGEYEEFGNDFAAVADQLAAVGVHRIRRGGEFGVEAPGFTGLNYISLYWGDSEAEGIKSLSNREIAEINSYLKGSRRNASRAGTRRKSLEAMTLAEHAEAWWREQGKKVPRKGTKAYDKMYERWHVFAFKSFRGNRRRNSPAGATRSNPRLTYRNPNLYTKPDITDVIFRRLGEDDVMALFPGLAADYWNPNWVTSYSEYGQHGPADYYHIIDNSRPASPREFAALKKELRSIGYKLNIVRKQTAKHRRMINRQMEEWRERVSG